MKYIKYECLSVSSSFSCIEIFKVVNKITLLYILGELNLV